MPVSSEDRALAALVPSLVALVELADRTSITQAAVRLRVAPSTLSRQVARLEDELGVVLVEQVGQSLRMGDAGRALAVAAAQALDVLRPALDDARPGQRDARPVRLGLIRTLGPTIAPEALAEVERSEDLLFELTQASTEELTERLVSGDLDLALLTPPPDDRRLASADLFEQALDAVLPAGHPLADRESIDLDTLAREPIVLLHPAYGTRMAADRLAEAGGVHLRIVLETDDVDLARGLSAAGFGVAIVPRLEDYHRAAVRELRIDHPAAVRTVCIAWRADRRLPPQAERLRSALMSVLRRPR